MKTTVITIAQSLETRGMADMPAAVKDLIVKHTVKERHESRVLATLEAVRCHPDGWVWPLLLDVASQKRGRTMRHPLLQELGKGRHHASDGAAWQEARDALLAQLTKGHLWSGKNRALSLEFERDEEGDIQVSYRSPDWALPAHLAEHLSMLDGDSNDPRIKDHYAQPQEDWALDVVDPAWNPAQVTDGEGSVNALSYERDLPFWRDLLKQILLDLAGIEDSIFDVRAEDLPLVGELYQRVCDECTRVERRDLFAALKAEQEAAIAASSEAAE
jgi:hypothetical protein